LVRLALLLPLAACGASPPQHAEAAFETDSGYITTDDGIRLFYRSVGTGGTTIIVPVALYLEEALLPLAAADRRLVFYDPRARGRSDAGDRARITLDRQIADLDAVRAGLGVDSMVLIGWSGLGMETAVYAMRHPERVIRLLQVAPVAARDEPHNAQAYRTRVARIDTAALARVRARRDTGDLAADEGGYCRALGVITLVASFADRANTAEVPDPCRFPNEYPDSLNRVFRPLLGSFEGYDWREAAGALTMPRLVVHGRADAFPLEGSREWVPTGSNAQLLVIDHAGHFPFIEQPDLFFPAVDLFLRGEWPRKR
jgi:proline iminopeptidase